MSRFPFVFEFLGEGLFDVGVAMLDGSYWEGPKPWERGNIEYLPNVFCDDTGGEG